MEAVATSGLYYYVQAAATGTDVRNWLPVHEGEKRWADEGSVVLTKLSAAVVMPPKELWPPLLAIKARHKAPHVPRPPYPHITVASPFVEPQEFGEAEVKVRRELQHVAPVEVRLRRFDFLRQKKALTLVLIPEPEPVDGLQQVFDGVLRAFPKCSAQAPFLPHLTMGHFEDEDEAERMRERYQAEWEELRFTVREVHLMARTASGPFEALKAIPLGAST